MQDPNRSNVSTGLDRSFFLGSVGMLVLLQMYLGYQLSQEGVLLPFLIYHRRPSWARQGARNECKCMQFFRSGPDARIFCPRCYPWPLGSVHRPSFFQPLTLPTTVLPYHTLSYLPIRSIPYLSHPFIAHNQSQIWLLIHRDPQPCGKSSA